MALLLDRIYRLPWPGLDDRRRVVGYAFGIAGVALMVWGSPRSTHPADNIWPHKAVTNLLRTIRFRHPISWAV
jgi:hypothetical protein